jgi:uncharacterized protein
MMILEQIWIYPIKSLAGISLKEAMLEERGLQYDRRWMLVDENGVFITQRKNHELAFLQVEWQGDFFQVFDRRFPMDVCNVPLAESSGISKRVVVWDDEVDAEIVNIETSKWFSNFLGKSCDLVFMPENSERRIPQKYAVNNENVSFADGMPYLIAGLGSLEELNQRLENPVPMNRFRPNFIFSGGSAFEEDSWRRIKIGEALFQVTKPCARCVFINVDQETVKVSQEPLRTLNLYRNFNGKVMFGQNMISLAGELVKVGDPLEVLSRI